jgi:hypothetical protein
MKQTTFENVPIGTEFWWGGFTPERCNWGRKRSNRTADWRPLILGELSSFERWGYWKKGEVVYVAE